MSLTPVVSRVRRRGWGGHSVSFHLHGHSVSTTVTESLSPLCVRRVWRASALIHSRAAATAASPIRRQRNSSQRGCFTDQHTRESHTKSNGGLGDIPRIEPHGVGYYSHKFGNTARFARADRANVRDLRVVAGLRVCTEERSGVAWSDD